MSLWRTNLFSYELETLATGNNKLEGTIPDIIGYKISKLLQIELAYNQFSGSIPKSLGNCSTLHFVSVTYNNLSGEIPPKWGMLNRLQSLQLGSNWFKGNIFPFLLNCTQLQHLGHQ
ncbi:hypothetical protein SUGI_1046850 [Cryptomeria japonica]|nr:hypothetical protein SUGI_1046850 [Cryptomeria japonica]